MTALEQMRIDAEFFPTPIWAAEALLERVQFANPVWEPAAGDGAIANVLAAHGYEVLASDLYDYGNPSVQSCVNFLTVPTTMVGSVVTNPPFTLAESFIAKALDCAEHRVAMLLRLAFLEGQKRQAMWQSTPLEDVLVFSRRVAFVKEAKIPFAWFVWKRGYAAKPTIEWITADPKDGLSQ